MALAIAGLFLVLLALGLRLAFPLPGPGDFPPDPVLPERPSALVEASADLAAEHPGESGLRVLSSGEEAFAARMALVRRASRSIDARYYIWEGDLTGRMLLAEIVAAADRGVRVRLLVDDNPTAGLDPMWGAAAAHPNIAVRLFNPMTIRAVRSANYLFDFPRLNRRMHNKSLTVDDAVTIVGGRNVGDEYFGAGTDGLFIDLDMLAVGAIVPEVVRDFERYWSSEAAYPAGAILPPSASTGLAGLRDPAFADAVLAARYRAAADSAAASLTPEAGEGALLWARAELVSDNPAKAHDKASRADLLAARIVPLIAGARERIDLVSGYFVPGRRGAEWLSGLARKGVRVRIVTNSIQVTDVPVVHAGYAPYRAELLTAGAELYEARPLGVRELAAGDLGQTRFSGGGESVHAKTFAVDGRYVFVGSFNFDPRSALLNCEMGLVIDAPELAEMLAGALDRGLPDHSYRLSQGEDGSLRWNERSGGNERIHTSEPGTTAPARALVWAMSKLPIEWML